ncbi:nucleotidyltransferase family protein [Flavobacterium nackdongense]|uniref:Nucleotidyltransferase domain-containing protein n=1 Tax=Flavobacterium nackdongense TaxID=2547394 RepID=A0A4P6YE64_9FLAO|nr:nucleotidyltransferase domain-containing protein [Flavobacterium nackdongense]QBN18720.1 nucleotidyltransferase domain-containing protein [Flavobacterium nackdongense]
MEKQIETKLPQIKNVFTKYGAERVFLFGSAATNKFNENSDVDFLYSFSEDLDYETYANNYFSLLEELQALLKTQVDLVAEKTLRNPYLIESINESKIQLL